MKKVFSQGPSSFQKPLTRDDFVECSTLDELWYASTAVCCKVSFADLLEALRALSCDKDYEITVYYSEKDQMVYKPPQVSCSHSHERLHFIDNKVAPLDSDFVSDLIHLHFHPLPLLLDVVSLEISKVSDRLYQRSFKDQFLFVVKRLAGHLVSSAWPSGSLKDEDPSIADVLPSVDVTKPFWSNTVFLRMVCDAVIKDFLAFQPTVSHTEFSRVCSDMLDCATTLDGVQQLVQQRLSPSVFSFSQLMAFLGLSEPGR